MTPRILTEAVPTAYPETRAAHPQGYAARLSRYIVWGCRWACEELNLGPHAYQTSKASGSFANRPRYSPESDRTPSPILGLRPPRNIGEGVPQAYPSNVVLPDLYQSPSVFAVSRWWA